MSTNPRSIGWLGTGRMGAAMAARLIDAGEDVTVWNRTPSKTGPLVAKGARAVERITDLGGCDVVFVMVSTPADLEEVVCGEHGLLSADQDRGDLTGAGRRPGMIVDCSTVSEETSARVRAAADAAGVGFLAAPVSGNPHVVAEGGCCIVASGPAEVFEQVRPYLEEIAKLAVHAGEGEQARLVKLCHNLYLGIMVQALVEVTSLAEKGGTDRAAFLEFLGGTVLGVRLGAQAHRRPGQPGLDPDVHHRVAAQGLRPGPGRGAVAGGADAGGRPGVSADPVRHRHRAAARGLPLALRAAGRRRGAARNQTLPRPRRRLPEPPDKTRPEE